MKILLCFILFSMLNVSGSIFSQSATFDLAVNGKTVKEVFKDIESQSDFRFLYNDDFAGLNRMVSFNTKERNIDDVFNELPAGSNLNYEELENEFITITPLISEAQEHVVTGQVTDAATGEPLPGVSIMIQGTTIGTVSDINGDYNLEVPGPEAVIVFSYIGYFTQEIPVGDNMVIDVVLNEDVQMLDEIVVIGYGVASRSDLTGSITNVRADEIRDYAPSHMSDFLRTGIPGMNVSYSTSAKGSSSFLIRGETTLTAGSGPLIVLDGVIYNGDMSDINPDDIDRIDIMKDASSAAVYGSRASNGVIAITTKKGTHEKPVINVSSTMGIATESSRRDPYDEDSFIQWRSDMFKSVYSATVQYEPWSPFDDPRTIDSQYLDDWMAYHGTTEANLIDAWLGGLRLTSIEIDNYKTGNVIDWEDHIFHNAMRQDYNLSIAGRTNDVSYYWSLGYMDNEALAIGDEFSTIRSRINLEGQPANFLRVGMNAQFSYRDESSIPVSDGQYQTLTPYSSFYDDDGESIRLYPNGDHRSSHPLLNPTYRNREREHITFFPKLYSVLELPYGISYTMNFTTRIEQYSSLIHNSSEHPLWTMFGGSASRDNRLRREWQVDNIVNWNRTFFDRHKVDVTLLANAEKYRVHSDGMSNRSFEPNDLLGFHDMSTGVLPELSTNDQVQTGDALMARLNYGYDNRYLLTLSFRRDGSSLFGYSNPRANFPAAAVGWVVTEENFFSSDFIDYLKIRASWGTNGNRSISNYAALSRMSTGRSLNASQSGTAHIISTLMISTMENRDLKWERTEAYNIGADFNLFSGILSGSIEAYDMSTMDVLVNRELPSLTGYNRVYANLGEVENKGVELALNSLNLRRNNFEWRSNFAFALNRNKIISIIGEEGEPDDINNNWFIGEDKSVIWDYNILGTWKVGEESEAAKWNQAPGDFRLEDVNNDGLLTNEDKQFLGYRDPRFTWSLTNRFTLFENIEASFVLFSLWGQMSPFDRAKHADHTEDRGNSWELPYWTPYNQIDDFARLRSAPAQGVNYNTYFDRSYIRLEHVAIAYTMPAHMLKNINDLKISFSIRNAALWAPEWTFGDPEHGTRAQRIYALGINFNI